LQVLRQSRRIFWWVLQAQPPAHFRAAVFTAFSNRPFARTNFKNHQSARHGVDTRNIVACANDQIMRLI